MDSRSTPKSASKPRSAGVGSPNTPKRDAFDLLTKKIIIEVINKGLSHTEVCNRYKLKNLSSKNRVLKDMDRFLAHESPFRKSF